MSTLSTLQKTSLLPAVTNSALNLTRQANSPHSFARGRIWAGRLITGIPALFLLLDGVMKLVKPTAAVKATLQLGYQDDVLVGLGLVLLTAVVLFLLPRTSLLGAILLTGYLGGAVATHVRVGNPLVSHVLFPVYLGVLIWGGLWLRETRLSLLLPLRK